MSEFKFIEGLVIGPEDRLVLNLDKEHSPYIDEILEGIIPVLEKLGLRERTLLLAGGVEIGKVTP